MTKKKNFLSASFFLLTIAVAAHAAADSKRTTYGLGIEGFQDRFSISALDQDNTTNYGSVTGYYQRSFLKSFTAVDARVSYGTEQFESNGHSVLDESPVGKISGIPQWDMELRGRFGLTIPMWGGSFSPYIGVGARYHRDEGKGYVTDQGYELFDTRTFQFYIPVGASLAIDAGNGWTVTPQAEVDFSPYGDLTKRITSLNHSARIYFDNSNTLQHGGIGGRSEIMFGKASDGYAWQFGPFVRYWYFTDSTKTPYRNISTNQIEYIKEPANSSTQIGVSARVLW